MRERFEERRKSALCRSAALLHALLHAILATLPRAVASIEDAISRRVASMCSLFSLFPSPSLSVTVIDADIRPLKRIRDRGKRLRPPRRRGAFSLES